MTQPQPAKANPLNSLQLLGLMGYDEVVRAAMTAFCAKEHMLLLGGPGQAKSEAAMKLLSTIEHARIWKIQLTKSADESNVFGLPNIEKLLKGEIEYAERIPALEAELWFIDEFFDAADVVLRSLLGCMNEREFIKGSSPRRVNLHTCIATANYSRVNEVTAAVVDRFVITCNAPLLTVPHRKMLYDESTFKVSAQRSWTLEKLNGIQAKANEVKIPGFMVDVLVDIAGRHNFSPRRERKLAKLLRTYAAMRGKTVVDGECLEPFKWTLPISVVEKDRQEALRDVVQTVASREASSGQFEILEKLQRPYTLQSAVQLANIVRMPSSELVRAKAQELLEVALREEPGFKSVWERAQAYDTESMNAPENS